MIKEESLRGLWDSIKRANVQCISPFSCCYKDTCTRMFIAALFTIAKTWNQPKCPSMIDWTGKMWHIYTMEYAAIKKWWVRVFCREIDESGEHHSQQTDTRTEHEIPHILTHRRVMNNKNTWTQGREHYTLGSIGGNRGGTAWGELGRDSMGRNAGCGWRGGRQQTHCHVCTYATILHVLLMYLKT